MGVNTEDWGVQEAGFGRVGLGDMGGFRGLELGELVLEGARG